MTLSRTVAWIGGVTLAAAWLASAAGVGRQPRTIRTAPRSPEADRVATLAADVQTQAARLRHRLAAAPAPQAPARNPFTFAERRIPESRTRVPAPAVTNVEPAPPPVVEMPLSLIGIAEDRTAAGLVRTAMIAGPAEDDLHLLTPGQTLAGRYRVVAVGADAVELSDLVTGAVRRLALN
jgi:hypothetical protein